MESPPHCAERKRDGGGQRESEIERKMCVHTHSLYTTHTQHTDVSEVDMTLLERELGYRPPNILSVAHRLADGTPSVIECYPLLQV
jgi:hypothetical protein